MWFCLGWPLPRTESTTRKGGSSDLYEYSCPQSLVLSVLSCVVAKGARRIKRVSGGRHKRRKQKFLLWTCPEASRFGSFMAGQRGEMLGHQTTKQIRKKTICVWIGW